jgi:phosphopentomutase
MSAEMIRAVLIVLDSVGCGGAEDAKAYGNEGADTLGHIAEACAAGKGDRAGLRNGPLRLPRLEALGLGHAMKASTGRAPNGATASRPRAARTRRRAIGSLPERPSTSTGAISRRRSPLSPRL